MQGIDTPYRIRILQEYVDVVVLRDVVERHGVANLTPLRYLIRHLLGAPACAFSVNRFHNDLKSQGIACGKNSLHEYLAHLEDAYLVQSVSLDSRSVRQRQVNPRKVYPIDTDYATKSRTRRAGCALICIERSSLSATLDGTGRIGADALLGRGDAMPEQCAIAQKKR